MGEVFKGQLGRNAAKQHWQVSFFVPCTLFLRAIEFFLIPTLDQSSAQGIKSKVQRTKHKEQGLSGPLGAHVISTPAFLS